MARTTTSTRSTIIICDCMAVEAYCDFGFEAHPVLYTVLTCECERFRHWHQRFFFLQLTYIALQFEHVHAENRLCHDDDSKNENIQNTFTQWCVECVLADRPRNHLVVTHDVTIAA